MATAEDVQQQATSLQPHDEESILMFNLCKQGSVTCSTAPADMFDGAREVYEWPVVSSADKEILISRVEGIIDGDGDAHEFLRQRAALVMDEMLENALYCAPRDANGKQLYSKGEKRSLCPGEKIMLRCAYDGEKLLLEVSDNWGKLSPETVQGFITLNLEPNDSDDRAGRGLYLMWKFMKDFYVKHAPDIKTSVGGYLLLDHASHEYGTV